VKRAGGVVRRRAATVAPEVADVLAGLRERGFRLTAPRQFVIEVLAATDEHLSVEQIHSQVAKISAAVNLSTVHRTVGTLLDEEIVHAVPTRRGLTYGLARDHHNHTLCRVCGATSMLADRVAGVAGLPAGFAAEAVIVYGRCADCAAADAPP
jgi:Fe2+ or Zn2+ uptake regulation protein